MIALGMNVNPPKTSDILQILMYVLIKVCSKPREMLYSGHIRSMYTRGDTLTQCNNLRLLYY